MAAIWGDTDKGAHATFTKFAPGFDAGMHTHTNDVWIVVVKGAYLYKDAAGEKRVGPGSFLRVPGGWKHWSGAIPKRERCSMRKRPVSSTRSLRSRRQNLCPTFSRGWLEVGSSVRVQTPASVNERNGDFATCTILGALQVQHLLYRFSAMKSVFLLDHAAV